MRTILAAMMVSAFATAPACPQDYFPLKEGNQWTYTMSDGTAMTMKVTGCEDVDGVRCAIVESDVGGQVNKAYYAVDSQGLKDYGLEISDQRFTYDPPVLRVKLPFEKGQRWTCDYNQFGTTMTTQFESVGAERIETQAGTFECIVIRANTSTPDRGSMVSDSYYADGQGFIYQKIRTNGQEYEVTLASSNIQSARPALEKYVSPMGTIMLYKPHDWNVMESNRSERGYAVTIANPQETAVVLFMTLPVNERTTDSLLLANRYVSEFGSEITEFQAKSVNSTPGKDRTIMELSYMDEGKEGFGHGYFFYSERVGTVYFLLCHKDEWSQLRPVLTTIAANIAYSPNGIATVTKQGMELAAQMPATRGRVLSPAAMLQQAKSRPGKQLTLVPAALPDRSLLFQIPQGWSLEGQELKYSLVDNPQTRSRGMCSVSYSIIPTEISVPGVLNTPYQPPPQALRLLFQFTRSGTNIQMLGEIPGEQAMPELAQAVQNLRAQGLLVDSRLMHVRFTGLPSGATLRGLFSVQCSAMPMSPVWQVTMDGSWAPDDEFDEWLPLYLRIGQTFNVNREWTAANAQDRFYRQRQLNRNLQNSIAERNQAFDRYLDSAQNAGRSQDYSSWMWSQTTLGQGTWVAENEGAHVYRTDEYGLESPDGRIDRPAYNTANFTGESPWDARQLELIDTREEFERHMENN